MKVISLLQPWATLVVMGAKKIETRSWNTKHRGELLIHASKSKAGISMVLDTMTLQETGKFLEFIPNLHSLPFGAIIGKLNLIDTLEFRNVGAGWNYNGKIWDLTEYEKAFGDYTSGRYGWLLSDPVQFKKITPAKGSLSLWDFKEQICLKCGCTENNACISPEFGPCWWVEENLCSHCKNGIGDDAPI